MVVLKCAKGMKKFLSGATNLALIGGTLLISLAVFLYVNKSPQTPAPTPSPTPAQETTNNTPPPQVGIKTYKVVRGDTLKEIAEVYGVNTDTVKWANNLTSEKLTPGQTLQILPVNGIAHTVVEGDTLESIAKMYNAETQKIIDYPGNSFADSQYSLAPGSAVIVPGGTK